MKNQSKEEFLKEMQKDSLKRSAQMTPEQKFKWLENAFYFAKAKKRALKN